MARNTKAATTDAVELRPAREIAADLLPPDDPSNIVEIVRHLEVHELEGAEGKAAPALEALYWLGRARAGGWEWGASGAREADVPSGAAPAHVKVPAWVVEVIAAAWVAYTRPPRNGRPAPKTLDEAFGTKRGRGQKSFTVLRKHHQRRLDRGLQAEDLKRRTGMTDTDARRAVEYCTGHDERIIADDHRLARDVIAKRPKRRR